MTSKIKVDNINKVSDDSNIIKKCGTTTTIGSGASNPIVVDGSAVTIGRCGGTVALASGATQTGFGRTGTVDWQTGSIKTTTFTAASGEGYFVNTTSGVVTVNLPASPSAGDIVAISDYAGTAATNKITIARNGSNFEGEASNGQIIVNRQAVTLVYVDGTQGWVPVGENDSFFQQPLFVTATGGTITTSGNFKIHTFTGPGTFCVSCAGNSNGSNKVDYLVIAGGGSGGKGTYAGGGGGAGGYRESPGATTCYTASPLGASPAVALSVTATGFPITVGAGGTAGSGVGNPGANSIFSTITSAGGGGGGGGPNSPGVGVDGGSGGGGATYGTAAGGSGNTPPVSPAQGKDGGTAGDFGGTATKGAGGGGASAAGGNAVAPPTSAAGSGGNGTASSITGSPVTRAGGGGGSTDVGGPQGSGGPGGGGVGDQPGGGNGTANEGAGGGGGRSAGGNGGSGVVIIRYKFQ